MVTIEEIQAAYYMVAATGVLVAAVFYIVNVRITLETRQAQIYLPLFNHQYSETYVHDYNTLMMTWQWSDVNDFFQRYLGKPDEYDRFVRVFTYFEGIGVLVKNRLIDPRLIDDQFSWTIISFWQKFRPAILEVQRRTESPELGEYTELLYDRVKPLRDLQRSKRALKGGG